MDMDSLQQLIADLYIDQEVTKIFTGIFLPHEFQLADRIRRTNYPATIFGIPVVQTRAVPPGQIRLMEGDSLTDIGCIDIKPYTMLE